MPLGFVSDHMEVLWDLDTEAMDAAQAAGIRAVRTPTPGIDPAFVSGLVDLVVERRDGTPASERPHLDPARPLVRRVPTGLLRERPCRFQARRLGGGAMTALFKPGAPIRVGTRASALAVAQTSATAAQLGAYELVTITSEGDRSTAPLASMGGTGVFVSALRDALLRRRGGPHRALVQGPPDGAGRRHPARGRADPRGRSRRPRRPRRRDPRASSPAVPASEPVRRGGARSCSRHGRISRSSASAAMSTPASDGSTTPTTTAASTGSCSRRPGWSGSAGSARRPSCCRWSRGRPRPRRARSRWRSGRMPLAQLVERVATIDDAATRIAATAERGVLARLEAGCSAPIAAHADPCRRSADALGDRVRARRNRRAHGRRHRGRRLRSGGPRSGRPGRRGAARSRRGRASHRSAVRDERREGTTDERSGRAGARHPPPPHPRQRAWRRLVAQTRLHPADLVLPMFVREGVSEPVPISSMPGVVQHTLDSLKAALHRRGRSGHRRRHALRRSGAQGRDRLRGGRPRRDPQRRDPSRRCRGRRRTRGADRSVPGRVHRPRPLRRPRRGGTRRQRCESRAVSRDGARAGLGRLARCSACRA